jgi:hypothetical protein
LSNCSREEMLRALFKSWDRDGSGEVEYGEGYGGAPVVRGGQ